MIGEKNYIRSFEELQFILANTLYWLETADEKKAEEGKWILYFTEDKRQRRKANRDIFYVKDRNFEQFLEASEKIFAEKHGERPLSIQQMKDSLEYLGILVKRNSNRDVEVLQSDGTTKVEQMKVDVISYPIANGIMDMPLLAEDTKVFLCGYADEWLSQIDITEAVNEL